MKYFAIGTTALMMVFLSGNFFGEGWCQQALTDSVQIKKPQSSEKTDTLKLAVKSPTGAFVRSLIFPGLGQWYNGKKLKAVVIFFGQTGLAANAIYLNQQLVKSHTDNEREFYINNRNLSVWWLIGVTLFSMADAYVDAQMSDFDESLDLSHFQIQPMIEEKSASVSILLSYRF
ncbi:MAG: hypothetical protein GXO74_11365 [Calditrichaeota bacterium]|nr:hypothetical protein [Calditrichota bacterium]